MLFLACASFAADVDAEPRRERRTWSQGLRSVAVGTAAIQVPGLGRGSADYPSLNVNATYRMGVPRSPVLLAAHGAFSRDTYDQRQLTTYLGRAEARGGARIALWNSGALDLTTGLSVDVSTEGVLPGLTLNAALLQWLPLGDRKTVFVLAEGRLAPIGWGYSNQMGCDGYCNQTHTYNPGGTGVLVQVGASWSQKGSR